MKWNVKEAALACGIAPQSWRHWELSGSEPRKFAEVAQRISECTGVDEYWLVMGVERPEASGESAARRTDSDNTV